MSLTINDILKFIKALLYKHQSLFDEFKLSDCPSSSVVKIQITAYRWSHAPIGNELNFLPNILYDRMRERPSRHLEPKDICANCNLSFFIKEETAMRFLKVTRERLEKKHQPFTYYTHIAFGPIEENDGRATIIKKDHFGFYEYEKCDFAKKFKISETPL